MKVTKFKDQAAKFLLESTIRKRDPVRPATIKRYQEIVRTHLNPVFGEKNLHLIGNKEVKSLVEKMSQKGLAPATIQLNVNLIKQIRASALNNEGEQLYPYQWNSNFMDLPTVDPAAQKVPIASAQAVQDAIKKADVALGTLIALLAGSGLRIAEALAIKAKVVNPDDGVSTVWFPAESKIIIRQQRIGDKFGPTKTKAGVREIDLVAELNNFLIERTKPSNLELIFPFSETTYRNGLKNSGIVGGFHSLRRFRVTHLRLNGVPEALVQFWTGHAAGNVTERYTKVGEEIQIRKQHAERVGLGFELPGGANVLS